jgi:hypothetical protein
MPMESMYHWNLHNSIFKPNSSNQNSVTLKLILGFLWFYLIYIGGPIFGYIPHLYDVRS